MKLSAFILACIFAGFGALGLGFSGAALIVQQMAIHELGPWTAGELFSVYTDPHTLIHLTISAIAIFCLYIGMDEILDQLVIRPSRRARPY